VICRLRRPAVAAAIALSLAVAAACGGDDGGEGAAGPTDGDPRTTSGGVLIGPAGEGLEGVQAYRIDSTTHTEDDLEYDLTPPVGGEHYAVPGTCGFYEEEPPPDEMIVHDLEHGAVWVAYDPDLDDAQQVTLRELVAQQAKVIATPYPGLESPVVVSAWGRQLALDSADDPRLAQFVTTYRNSAAAPEPQAACQGAGQPAVLSPTA
jgi:uncharacterized protein DUF3105